RRAPGTSSAPMVTVANSELAPYTPCHSSKLEPVSISYASTYRARVPSMTSRGSGGAGSRFGPAGAQVVVTHELLVERRRRDAHRVVGRRPVARRVGRAQLVDHDD